MKKIVTKNNNQTSLLSLFAFLCCLLLVLSCEQPVNQPFKAGLGPIIDLQAPTVVLEKPNPKLLYIRGIVDFSGYATDDYKLESVWFQISNYQNVDLTMANSPNMPNYKKLERAEGIFYRVLNRGGGDRRLEWNFIIDTKLEINGKRAFLEGSYFKIRMLAIDSVGKEAITDDIVYMIKNDKPSISLNFPPVLPGTGPGDLGGDELNFGFLTDSTAAARPGQFQRVIATEGYIQGTIHDDQEINFTETGTEEITDRQGNLRTVELFPPQIRFWRVDTKTMWTPGDSTGRAPDITDSNGIDVPAYKAGYLPTLTEVPWEKLGGGGDQNQLLPTGSGLQDAIFLYQVSKESGAYYGLEVRAQSNDTLRSSVRYPRDYHQKLEPYDPDEPGYAPDDTQKENAYVLIYVVEPQENPILELYGLQDIKKGGGGREDGVMQYARLSEITNKIAEDGNHPYVDKPIVSKGGAFTLRMKASHSGGIKSAVAIWEKDDDKSVKGRFIWDPVDSSNHSNWIWNTGEPVPASQPYEEWGFKEPDGDIKVRSFVYTYHDVQAQDRIPNTGGYNEFVRGRSTIQVYNGPAADDKGKTYSEDQLPEINWQNGNRCWNDYDNLPDGTYNLRIYTTSNSGTRIAVPYSVTIKIDRIGPDFELLYIDGSAGETGFGANTATIVNGVIRPRFQLSDSRPEDTGIRKGSDDLFLRSDVADSYYPEQMYVVVKDDMKTTLETYLSNIPGLARQRWPELNVMKSYISSWGVIVDSECYIRTSHIYTDESDGTASYPENDLVLEDGIYWLYGFARDNAFNVKRLTPERIKVEADSDIPTFQFFDPVNENVIEPDSSYDLGGTSYGTGPNQKEDASFITSNGIRNKFSANSSIRVRIRDDDSLDLGEGEGTTVPNDPKASKIKVTFIGSKPDTVKSPPETIIQTPDTNYLITLSDAEVKEIFGSQPVENGQRKAVKDVTGVISQTLLLDKLKEKDKYNYLFNIPTTASATEITAIKNGFNSLPDGIYRVSISIQDDNRPSIKFLTKNDENRSDNPNTVNVNNWADFVKVERTFWIAVDNNPPTAEFTVDKDNNDQTKTPLGPFISNSKQYHLTGTVSDEIGPITLVGWTIYGDSQSVVSSSKTPVTGKPTLTTPATPTTSWGNFTYDTTKGKWIYDFDFTMDLKGDVGTFTYELEFKDRFGNASIISRKYSVDVEPPRVSLTKPIKTFERVEDNVFLDDRTSVSGWKTIYEGMTLTQIQNDGFDTSKIKNYVQLADPKVNKARLAVKVVNFTINATDNFKLKGVRWWLLPANQGVDNNYNTYGTVLDYNAFPANTSGFDGIGVYYSKGAYFASSALPTPTWNNSYTPITTANFNIGAYGVVDVENRKFTIAVDTQRMEPANGEYRLHIIAIDDAGNVSRVTEDLNKLPTSNLFQEVFFLQEEDRPYFGSIYTKDQNGNSTSTPNINITPGTRIYGTEALPSNTDVIGGAPFVRGTVWENNGFSGEKGDGFYNGSIIIWFNKTGTAPPTDWEQRVNADNNPNLGPNWEKKEIPTAPGDLGRQGTNISLGIALTALFDSNLGGDGEKRYIIKAVDSPWDKLSRSTGTALGTGDAPGNTNSTAPGDNVSFTEDANARVSRAMQYAFVYDSVPPVIKITNPGKNQTFGKNFGTDFKLEGNIFDKNLANMAYYKQINPNYTGPGNDNDYYFEYYLDNDTSNRKLFVLDSSNTGITVTVDSATNPVTVTFSIAASLVESQIITNFNTLTEGQHSLNLFAWDKSGKEGAARLDFTKDMTPPVISFTTLSEKPYDKTNKSIVQSNWGTLSETARQPYVFGTAPIPANNAAPAYTAHTLSLTTIYYDSNETPELRGSITDLISQIDLGTLVSGNTNDSTSKFKYWIDNETQERYAAVIEGAPGMSVRWTIYLTIDGTKGAARLVDGIHTIRLTAADMAGQDITADNQYTVAFRIDSKPPTAKITGFTGALSDKTVVYGDVRWQDNPIFDIGLWGHDANLRDMTLSIKDQAGNVPAPFPVTFRPADTDSPTGSWLYYPFGYPATGTFPPAGVPPVAIPPAGLPALTTATDNIVFSRSYSVQRDMFTIAPSGDYEVVLTASDYANNVSEQSIEKFTYDKTAPVIEFSNPPDDYKEAGLPPGLMEALIPKDLKPEDLIDTGDPSRTDIPRLHRLTSEELKIEGFIKDDFSAVRQVQSRVEKWNWLTATWVVIEPWTDVRDLKDNTLRQITWTKNLMGQGGGFDIRDFDKTNNPSGEGLYRIRIRAKDSSYIKNGVNPDYDNRDTWSYTPASGTTPAPDRGNPALSQYVYFYYDRTAPVLKITGINGSTTTMDTYYSTLPEGFKFEGTVTDDNRFAKVEVVMQSQSSITEPATLTSDPMTVTTSLNQGTATQNWVASFPNPNYPDGRYKVTVTVYDMTGRSAKEEKSFILDKTPPGLKFTGPVKTKDKGFGFDQDPPSATSFNEKFASALVPGGETSVITGETWDKSDSGSNGSESGVDQMWFHLGFIDGSAAFPTEETIKIDELRILKEFVKIKIPGTNDTSAEDIVKAMKPAARNEALDEVAKYLATGNNDLRGNAWFKLGGSNFPRPTGFVINNPNIYDWRMEIPNKLDPDHPDYGLAADGQIGGLKLYTKGIKVKGRDYVVTPGTAQPGGAINVPAGTLQMVRSVPNEAGIYRLPLWVRLVDKVGNVSYSCHDIWIDPDADIPKTTIESPSNGNQNSARGGAISVDGVARSNTSVYDVIFRVFADNTANTDLDGTKNYTPNPNTPAGYDYGKYWVRVTGYDPADDKSIALLPVDYKPGSGAAWTWQKANLTLTGGSGEPLIPWSIMLNSGDQITNLIKANGFSSKGSGDNDMIRVWLEVFVFNGEGSPIRSSIYPDDLLKTANDHLYGTADAPKPYVRAFYIKSAAPAITHPNVGSWSTSAPNANQFVYSPENPNLSGSENYGYKGAGTETRKDRFALKAILDPKGSTGTGYDLGEVSYRVRLDGGAYNTWTTLWKTGDTALPNGSNGIRITQRSGGTVDSVRPRYDFVYALNSGLGTTDTLNGTTFAGLNGGLWANSGGTITVQVRIRDTASPPNEAEQTIQVSVDNFTPVADTDVYITNSKVAGTNVDFMGRAFDYATEPSTDAMTTEFTPRKISKVYAWFTKNNQYVNINTGKVVGQSGVTPPATRTMSVRVGRAATLSYEAVAAGGFNYDKVTRIRLDQQGTVNTAMTLPALGSQAAHNADWVREISESTAIPGSKMLFSPVNSAAYDIRWSFNIDTTVLPDGEITLHYIVEDAAGNASYYTQKTSVRNKYPQIDRVTLYTDNNGIGAVYTTHNSNNIASTEYDLNDYRNKMFANYSDPDDWSAWNPAPASASSKLDSVGYLNSGFISKNQYVGFKVETSYGNRALNFRLQYVTRERLRLTKSTLDQMVLDRNDATKINLYTIAWNGDYSNAKWRALGVPVDNPRLGTHFVFNPPEGFDTTAAAGTAEVWKYSQVASVKKGDFTPTGQPADDAVVFGPDNPGVADVPANKFDFSGSTYFNENPLLGISELMGSQPDARPSDLKQNNPKATAFFLIRVWDTVNPPADNASEAWVNEQLYDALVVGMNVYLKDTTPPTVRLYDLNPYAETAVVGNNIGTAPDPDFGGTIANSELTIRNAINPKGIGENILRGGLFNTKTEREPVKSGHIEPRNAAGPDSPSFIGSALHPRVKNPSTGVYETFEADGLIEGDTEANTYNNGTSWVTATRDMVSGKIILRGSAWDDQLIREIRVGIGATQPAGLYTISDKTNTILELDLSDTPATNSNYLTMKPSFVSGTSGPRKQAWAAEELHWKTGHTVEWAYVWDTEKVPDTSGTPASNIKVWVAVIDQLGNNKAGLPSSNAEITTDTESTETFKNTLAVDIVPYITGIERDSKYATRRSLQGWYSFFRGEPNVSIVGYNLRGRTMANPAVRIQTGASTYTTNPTITGTPTVNKITFTVPQDAVSGKILLYTDTPVGGSAEALNHRSNDKQSWNRESHYNTAGSDLWINKPYAHIWRTSDSDTAQRTYMGSKTISTTSGSAGLNHPGMALEYTGNNVMLHGTWAVYGYANVFYGTNNGTNNNLVAATPGEPYGTPDISIYNGGGRTAANIGYSYQGDGDPILYVKAVVNNTTAGSNIQAGNGPTQRFQNVRISKALANTSDAETNVGRIYMTAFDARYNSLWFGTRTGNNTVMTIDGGTGGAARISDTGNGLAPTANAGQFSAVDYDATGPIIAYYDQTNDTLRIALGLNTTPGTGANQWNRKYVLASGHPLYRGSGRYVSIKVDKDNGIHLAFFNSTRSTVVYAYAASRAADFTAYAVDDVVKGGTWTDISVDNNGNPWIVYGDSTRTGNYDGARMAYRSGTGTTTGIQFVRDKKDPVAGTQDITGWEAVSMPANYQVNNDRLNIEAWPPTVRGGTLGTAPGWNAAIGYASDMFRIGYFFYPGFKDGNY